MERRNLKKGAALWKQGDDAGTIAVVEDGYFGVLVDGHLTGLLWKGMVIGEGALLAKGVKGKGRSASVFALNNAAAAREIDAAELKAAFEAGDRFLVGPTLVTLVGEIVRNCLLLIEAEHEDPTIVRTMRAMMESTVEAFRERPEVEDWDAFLRRVGILVASRDFTDSLRSQLGVDGSDRAAIRKASDAVKATFKEHEALADLVALIDAENEKSRVVESASVDNELAFLVRG